MFCEELEDCAEVRHSPLVEIARCPVRVERESDSDPEALRYTATIGFNRGQQLLWKPRNHSVARFG